MRVTVSGDRLEREIVAELQKRIEKRSAEILRGVPVDVYMVRCAELRILTDLLAELPAIVKKAKD